MNIVCKNSYIRLTQDQRKLVTDCLRHIHSSFEQQLITRLQIIVQANMLQDILVFRMPGPLVDPFVVPLQCKAPSVARRTHAECVLRDMGSIMVLWDHAITWDPLEPPVVLLDELV